VILGARQLWQLRRAPMAPLPGVAASPRGAYVQGLGVSLSNPKVILFLGAFLPQFVQGDSGLPQLLLLALVFVVVLALVDIACAVAVARVRTARHAVRHTRVLNGISGALLLLGGLALAVARRP
jgi:threonine/homoserine/homoserine lactone efflux protein